MCAFVSKNGWSGHLKPLYNFYEAIYRCINSVSKGHNVLQLLDVSNNMIEIHSLIKIYSKSIVLYAIRKNNNAREIAEAFYNNARGWAEL